MAIKTFRDLKVWQKAMALVTEVYQVSKCFPSEEMYGLTSQIRRSAVSIPSNIAEGYGRNATNDYIRFLRISIGSLYELETQLEISLNLGYLNSEHFERIHGACREVERMLTSLARSLGESVGRGVKRVQRHRGTEAQSL